MSHVLSASPISMYLSHSCFTEDSGRAGRHLEERRWEIQGRAIALLQELCAEVSAMACKTGWAGHSCVPVNHSLPFLILFFSLYFPLSWYNICTIKRSPGGANGKEPACRRCRKHRFDPCVRNVSWRRAWQPIPVFLPRKSHGQRSLAGYSSMGSQRVGYD